MSQQTPKNRVLFVRSLWLTTLVLFGVFSLFALGLRSPQSAQAATSSTINFQSRLETSSGAIAPDGNYNVEFKLYSTASGGTAEWTEDYTYNSGAGSTDARLRVANGYLSVSLGSLTPFPNTIDWTQQQWLTMNIGGTVSSGTITWDGEMSPRLQLTAVPYAFAAGQLQTTSGSNTSTLTIQAPTGGNQTFVIQNQGAAGTYNLLTSGNGVQLQGSTPGTAQTGNINISGTGVFGTAIQTPGLDTPSAGTLTLGSANATSIALQQNTTVASNKSFTANGSALFKDATNSTSAFSIQNATSSPVFTVDTVDQFVGINTAGPSASLDVQASAGTFFDGFEGGALSPLTTSTPSQWSVTNVAPIYSGSFVLRGSGGSQNTSYVVSLNETLTAAGSVSFYYNCSWLYQSSIWFTIDGTSNQLTAGCTSLSANSNWQQASFTGIAAGAHTFSWSYSGGPGSSMSDLQYNIDNLVITNAGAAGTAALFNGGNVGIGNHAPSALLSVGSASQFQVDVNGNTQTTGTLQAASGTFTAGTLNLGTASTSTGSITLFSSAGSGSVALTLANPGSNNYTLSIPTLTGNDTICTVGTGCGGSGVTTVGTFSATSIVNGASISGSTITFGPADGTNPGMVTIGTQSFSGDKTFSGNTTLNNTTLAAGSSITITGGITSTRPASPTEGMVYYDTTTHSLLVYSNGKWQADRSTATKIVASGGFTGCTGTSPVASSNPDAADFVTNSCTSAQNAINSAIAALPAGGGTVYLMEGTYIIDGSISLPSNVTLMGAGSTTILKLKDGINANINMIASSGGSRMLMQNMKLDGNKANNTSGTQNGFAITGNIGSGSGTSAVPGITMYNLDIENFRSYGIDGSLAVFNNSSINNVSLINNGSSGLIAQGANVTISSSTAQGNGSTGFDLYSLTNSTFTGNTVVGNSGRGVKSTSGSNLNISNNVIKSNGSTAGIDMGGSSVTITGNTITGNVGSGISISGSKVTVSGNTITSNTSAGVATSFSSDDSIVGNTIASNSSYGVDLDVTGTSTVANNRIQDNGGSGSTSSIGITAGCCGGSNGNQIINNTITDTAGTGYAITITSGSSNYLSGNTFSGTGATSINDAGTGTIYANQADANGNLINKSQGGGFTIGTNTVNGTLSLQGGITVAALSSPAAPTLATGGTAGTTSYTYAVTALDGTGETLASTTTTITTGNATLNGTNYIKVTFMPVSGATSYKLYRTASGGTPATTGYIGTVNSTGITSYIFNDTGLAASGSAPAANTTGGGTFAGALQGTAGTFTSGTLTLGTASTSSGSIKLFSSAASGSVTLVLNNPGTGNYTLSIPTLTGNDTICTVGAANCGGGGGGGISTVGTFSATSLANGASISGSTITFGPADGTNPGMVSTGTQTFAGNKTFTGTATVATTSTTAFQIQNSGGSSTLLTADTQNSLITVSGGNIGSWVGHTAVTGIWHAVTYGNGKFVAVSSSSSPYVMTSPDGVTWTSQTAPASAWASVTYGNNEFVAVSSSSSPYVMTSPDGVTWTSQTAPASAWASVTYGNGKFVAVSNSGTTPYVMTSPDGITWTTQTASSGVWQSVIYANNEFVAVASGGSNHVMTSPDGVTWTSQTAPSNAWDSVTYGKGKFVAVADTTAAPVVMTSPDGVTWTSQTAPIGFWYSVAYGNGLFMAVGKGYFTGSSYNPPYAMSSTDGINWTSQTATSGYQLGITYNNGQFVGVGNGAPNYAGTFQYTPALQLNGGFQLSGSAIVSGSLSLGGSINAASYSYNSTAGATTTCSSGQFLQNQVVQGGITTGGTCATAGGGVTTVGTFSATSIANGASISGSTITFGPADATNPGMVTTGAQTFAGAKTFSGTINTNSGYSYNSTAGATTTCSSGQFLQNQVVQGGITTGGTCATAGGGVTTVGTFSATSIANGASISGSTITFGPADATNPGMVTTGAQTIAGAKTFQGAVTASSGVLTSSVDTAGASGTLNLGIANASTIYIGSQGTNPAIGISGATTFYGTTNTLSTFTVTTTSATALQVQNASSNTVLGVDTSANQVIFGKSSTVTGSMLLYNATNANTVALQSGVTTASYAITLPTTIGTAGQCLAIGSVVSSTANLGFANCASTHTKTIQLTAEYAGAVFNASNDTTCAAANTGYMTSDLYNSGNTFYNFYKWAGNNGATTQCYDVSVRVPIPSDFGSWAAAPTVMGLSSDGTAALNVDVRDTTGAQVGTAYQAVTGLSSTWSTATLGSLTGTYTPGGTMTIRIRMSAISTDYVELGNLTLTYTSAY